MGGLGFERCDALVLFVEAIEIAVEAALDLFEGAGVFGHDVFDFGHFVTDFHDLRGDQVETIDDSVLIRSGGLRLVGEALVGHAVVFAQTREAVLHVLAELVDVFKELIEFSVFGFCHPDAIISRRKRDASTGSFYIELDLGDQWLGGFIIFFGGGGLHAMNAGKAIEVVVVTDDGLGVELPHQDHVIGVDERDVVRHIVIKNFTE